MTNITDVKNSPVDSLVTSTALGGTQLLTNFSEAGHKVNIDQRSADGGKQLGRVAVASNGGGVATPTLLIAAGGASTDKWYNLTASITPAYTSLYPAPTVRAGSDSKPNFNTSATDVEVGLAAVPFPVVLLADVKNLGHPVNYHRYSGKSRGVVILVDHGTHIGYAIAAGSDPSDSWVSFDGTALTVVNGTLIASTSNAAGDGKPVVLATEAISSVDFPMVVDSDLADASYAPLYSEAEHSLAYLGDTALVRDAGGLELALMYGTYGTGIVWKDLGGVVSAVTPA